MDSFEKRKYYIYLFDFYETVLTDKQREYFREYYFSDLSLSEISNNKGISRSAVHDHLNKVHTRLDDLESKLNLFKKYIKREAIYKEYSSKEFTELINKLKDVE